MGCETIDMVTGDSQQIGGCGSTADPAREKMTDHRIANSKVLNPRAHRSDPAGAIGHGNATVVGGYQTHHHGVIMEIE